MESRLDSVRKAGSRLTGLSMGAWLLGCIPFFNILVGIGWTIYYRKKVSKLLGRHARKLSIFLVNVVCSVLSLVPFISILPWIPFNIWWTFRSGTASLRKHEEQQAKVESEERAQELKRQMAVDYFEANNEDVNDGESTFQRRIQTRNPR